jgi:hypothetical protein
MKKINKKKEKRDYSLAATTAARPAPDLALPPPRVRK